MKRLAFTLALVISASFLFAQSNDELSGLTKKEQRKALAEKNIQLVKQMVENKNFVLESQFLQDRYGEMFPVSQNLNFVSIASNEAVIQIGSNWRIGPNGVGGVTAKGKITKWELTENEKGKGYTIRANVMTPIGIYDLLFNIGVSGNSSALLTGLTSGSLTFLGDLVPHSQTTVYEGRSL